VCVFIPCLFSVCYGVVVIRHTFEVLPVLVCLGLIIWTLTPACMVVSTDYPNKLLLLELTCLFVCVCVCVNHDYNKNLCVTFLMFIKSDIS